MQHDRWNWFACGVVVGLLFGAGGAGGYAWMKLAEAERKLAEAVASEERERRKAEEMSEKVLDQIERSLMRPLR